MAHQKIATQRQRFSAAAERAGVSLDSSDRSVVLAQVMRLLVEDPELRDVLVFKGGAIMQHVDASPRFSRDIDANAVELKLLATRRVQKRWINRALNTARAKRVVRSMNDLVATPNTLHLPLIQCQAIASPPPVNISLSVTWREPLLLNPAWQTLKDPISGEEFSLLVMDPLERCSEKVRAILTRRRCPDAFDVDFYHRKVLQAGDRARLGGLVVQKLTNMPKGKLPIAVGAPLDQAFRIACEEIEPMWPGADLIIAEAAPEWVEIAPSLSAIGRLLAGYQAPEATGRRG